MWRELRRCGAWRRGAWRELRGCVAPVVLAGLSACSTGDPANPIGEPLPAVGASPLRRLSNDEYLNVLADTFPDLHPPLPDLPHDLAVAGFENAAETQEPSDVRIARFEQIADRYATAATFDTAAVKRLVGCDDWSTPSAAETCTNDFIARVGRRLFRRPLSTAEKARFRANFDTWQVAVDFEGAVRLTLSLLLQAPEFLYRLEPRSPTAAPYAIAPVDAFAMATRLSFLLWASAPDDALLEAAERNELQTEAQIRAEAERMLLDRRARRMYWDFHRQWLGLDRILQDEHLVRTTDVDAAWTGVSRASARLETQLFVENVLGEGGTFRDLWTSRRAWVNGEMARLYGLPTPADPDAWVEATLPEGERAGLLSRVSFLAAHSHRGATSPPVRANGIQLHMLCRIPVSPPPDADLSQPIAKPNEGPQTNRMLFETRTSSSRCQTCHVGLNGLGFGLENYDAAGRYHTRDNGLPIDARGVVVGGAATGADLPFTGAIELSTALADSDAVHRCAAERWIRFAFGRAPADAEQPLVEALRQALATNVDLHIVARTIATSPSFRLREESE